MGLGAEPFSWRGQCSFKFHGNELTFLFRLSASFDTSVLLAGTSDVYFTGSILYVPVFIWHSMILVYKKMTMFLFLCWLPTFWSLIVCLNFYFRSWQLKYPSRAFQGNHASDI